MRYIQKQKKSFMEFTFGIVTNNGKEINKAIQSIFDMDIPSHLFEIVIVGNCKVEDHPNIKKVPFDESIKRAWITKKKNLITLNATKENVVYLHDYVSFDKNWYKNFKEYGNDFDICLNPIKNPNGSRFRDYHLSYKEYDNFKVNTNQLLLPYDDTLSTDFMYINGTYWVAKKVVMEQYPLDEKQCWGECEDIIWSKTVKYHGNYIFKFNKKSICKLLKHKNTIFGEMGRNFYETKWLPFVKDKNRVEKEKKRNIDRATKHGSLWKRFLKEDQSEMYIKSRKKG